MSNPFAAAVHGGVEQVANSHRCLALAASTHGDPDGERQLVYRLLGRRVDGLVIMSARTDHTYLTGELDRGVPIVFVDRPARGIRATSVVAANRAATRGAVEHPIAHGHRRIAFLSDWPTLYTTARRHRGYLDAHHAHKLLIRRDLHRSGLVDAASTQHALTTLLNDKDPPTALFAANNHTCLRVLHALHRSGLMGTVALIGFDDIECAATLEVLLIISNVATAVVAYPVLRRESEIGAIGYVAARLVEAMFIAIGIVSALAFVLMRQDATATSNPVLGHVFVSIYYRAFGVGPGFFAGLANGVILGYLMYRSELVPRGMTWLGLIGGPLVMITGVLVIYNAIPRGGALQSIAGLIEGLWELSLSIYCIVKGFRLPSPILRPDGITLPEADSAMRHDLSQPDP